MQKFLFDSWYILRKWTNLVKKFLALCSEWTDLTKRLQKKKMLLRRCENFRLWFPAWSIEIKIKISWRINQLISDLPLRHNRRDSCHMFSQFTSYLNISFVWFWTTCRKFSYISFSKLSVENDYIWDFTLSNFLAFAHESYSCQAAKKIAYRVKIYINLSRKNERLCLQIFFKYNFFHG